MSPFDKQIAQIEDDQTAAVLLVGEEWMSGAQREELDAEVSKAATANAQALASALAIAFKPMTEALTAISTRLDTLEGKSSGGGGNNQQGGQRR